MKYTIKEIFADLAGAQVYSTLDLVAAYHKFQIKESDQYKTTFSHNGQQYMFQGGCFGLKPLGNRFQRVHSGIFADMPFVRVFVDDICIRSTDLATHAIHVKQAITALTNANLTINQTKSHFA